MGVAPGVRGHEGAPRLLSDTWEGRGLEPDSWLIPPPTSSCSSEEVEVEGEEVEREEVEREEVEGEEVEGEEVEREEVIYNEAVELLYQRTERTETNLLTTGTTLLTT